AGGGPRGRGHAYGPGGSSGGDRDDQLIGCGRSHVGRNAVEANGILARGGAEARAADCDRSSNRAQLGCEGGNRDLAGGIAGDGENVADRIVVINRGVAIGVNDGNQPAQLVINVLNRPIGLQGGSYRSSQQQA